LRSNIVRLPYQNIALNVNIDFLFTMLS